MMKRGLNLFKIRRKEGAETTTSSSSSSSGKDDEVAWEMRPGGMLVQKRDEASDNDAPPNLRVRVAYGAVRYQISANSLSTFGELKKLLTAETGLEPREQRLIFRGKERENGEYLDFCGVRDKSKVVLIEDPGSRERRMIEMRRNAKIQAVHHLIDGVAAEVDRLAEQVGVIEQSIASGNKIAEVQITTLMEMLMRQAVKLDSIPAQVPHACAKKHSQGERLRKCVVTLDILKVSNAKRKVPPVVSSKWETFETSPVANKWELFD